MTCVPNKHQSQFLRNANTKLYFVRPSFVRLELLVVPFDTDSVLKFGKRSQINFGLLTPFSRTIVQVWPDHSRKGMDSRLKRQKSAVGKMCENERILWEFLSNSINVLASCNSSCVHRGQQAKRLFYRSNNDNPSTHVLGRALDVSSNKITNHGNLSST